MNFLRVGWSGIPIVLTYQGSALVDPSQVTAARFRIFSERNDASDAAGRTVSASIGNVVAPSPPALGSLDATYTIQASDTVAVDTLAIYVECQIGAVWYSTTQPFKIDIKGHG